MTDPGAVPPLLPTELPPTTTRFLDAHASFLPYVGIFPKKCEFASLGERIAPFKPECGEMGEAGGAVVEFVKPMTSEATPTGLIHHQDTKARRKGSSQGGGAVTGGGGGMMGNWGKKCV